MQKLIIEAAINEGASRDANPNVPYSPEEVAADAISCAHAGASIIHFHARDPDSGDQRWIDADLYIEAMKLIEAECDAILYPSYTIRLPLEERYSHVEAMGREKSIRFEMATVDVGAVNMASFDSVTKVIGPDFVYSNQHAEVRRFIEIADDLQIVYGLGVREPGHFRHVLAYHDMGLLCEPVIVRFFFTDLHVYGLPPNAKGLQSYLDMIPRDLNLEWFIQSYGESHSFMQNLAISLGGHVRTGIGDSPRLNGEILTSAEQVKIFVGIAQRFGRDIAKPDEARAILGLNPQTRKRE